MVASIVKTVSSVNQLYQGLYLPDSLFLFLIFIIWPQYGDYISVAIFVFCRNKGEEKGCGYLRKIKIQSEKYIRTGEPRPSPWASLA